MGFSLKPIVGMPDGYYSLNLSIEKDRNCFASLLEQNEYMKYQKIRESFQELVGISRNSRGVGQRRLNEVGWL